MKSKNHYRIILVGKGDAHYDDRKEYIGQEGSAVIITEKPGNWCSCKFIPCDPLLSPTTFYKVLLKKLGQRKILAD